MTTINTVSLNFQAGGCVEFRDDRWAAYAEPSGITVYGKTEQEAKDRATDAVKFFIQTIHSRKGVDVARRYLDSHDVASTIVEGEFKTPIRYRQDVRSHPEVGAAA